MIFNYCIYFKFIDTKKYLPVQITSIKTSTIIDVTKLKSFYF